MLFEKSVNKPIERKQMTQLVEVTGPCKWARLYKSNMDTKFGERFAVSLYPDKKSIQMLKESGFRGKERNDEDGLFFKFSRDNISQIEGKGGPPEVLYKGKPFDKLIGNGSVLKLLLEIYPSKYGVGSRIKTVDVIEHVQYENAEVEGIAAPV